MSIYRARLCNTSNALSPRVSSEQIRLQVPPKLFGVDSWIPLLVKSSRCLYRSPFPCSTVGGNVSLDVWETDGWINFLAESKFSLAEYCSHASRRNHSAGVILQPSLALQSWQWHCHSTVTSRTLTISCIKHPLTSRQASPHILCTHTNSILCVQNYNKSPNQVPTPTG